MKETRRLRIKDKVFAKADIRRIAQVLLDKYQSTQEGEEDVYHLSSISVQLSCADDTSYESESIELFEDGGFIDIKKTDSIQMTFHNYALEQSIDFSIQHGGYRSSLIVRGNDKNWVNGTFTTLKEIVDSVKPQDNWILRHKTLFLHLIAIGTGSLIYLVLDALIYRHIQPIQNPSGFAKAVRDLLRAIPWLVYLIEWVLRWFMGIMNAAFPLRKWFLDLWPEIEFNFGPEHLNLEKARRERVWAVLLIIIFPVAIEIIGDILSGLRNGL